MIGHPEVALDHGADPRQSPSLGREAGPHRPLLEKVEQFLPLPGCQPRRTTRFGSSPQRRKPLGTVSQLLGPLTDGHPADTQATSDRGLRETAGAEQPACFEPALFELFGSEFSWSPHAYDRKTRREFVKQLT